MSFFGLNFGGGAEIDIILDDADTRKMADIKDENGRKERFFLFYDGESVTGKVNITLHRKTGKIEHQGIKIELIGNIEMYFDRGTHLEFLSLTKELARPGDLTQNTSFDFEFNQVEKPFETYAGVNVRLRYFLKVTMERRLTNLTKELDLAVHTLATYPEMNNPIKMEVGIEECLHIEFEYNKSKYHLKDVIVGKIYFLLVRIKIKHMEIAIIKRETCGTGPNTYQENENIAKYEIMDGAPVRGESIPIRVFLAGYDLTPTMRDINKKFSVRYYLNLVLVDEEDRRYFKQQEITLWRKGERSRKLPLSAAGSLYQQQAHALARHTAGDQPTEGVRTAPTPSLPPTPCVDNNPGFPTAISAAATGAGAETLQPSSATGSEAGEPSSAADNNAADSDTSPTSAHQSNGEKADDAPPVSNSVVGSSSEEKADDTLKDAAANSAEDLGNQKSADNTKVSDEIAATTTTTKLDDKEAPPSPPKSTTTTAPPDIVSGTANLSLKDAAAADSTKDLDVVSGGGHNISSKTSSSSSNAQQPPPMSSSTSPPPQMEDDDIDNDDTDLLPPASNNLTDDDILSGDGGPPPRGDSPPEMMDDDETPPSMLSSPDDDDVDLPDPPGSDPEEDEKESRRRRLDKKLGDEPVPAAAGAI